MVDKQNFIIPDSIRVGIKEIYSFRKELGSGAFGVVFLAKHRKSGEFRAIKAVAKDRVTDTNMFLCEVNILRQMDHPNIIKFYEVYESQSTVYLVTEYCEGGELFQFLTTQEDQCLKESDAAKIMRQIISSVAYCHEQKICHRDLKPENFLLKFPNDPSQIKMIDFGLAQKLENNEIMTSAQGTPYFIAPEMFEGKYNYQVDAWAVGVVLYILLSGSPPFYGKNPKEIFASIKKGNFDLDLEPFKQCSIESKDLIKKFLVKDPRRRLTAQQAYFHDWVQQVVSAESKNIQISKQAFQGIRKICESSNVQKRMYMYLAAQIPEKELIELNKIFVKVDTNGNGLLSEDELCEGFKEFSKQLGIQIDVDGIKKLFKAIDIDGNGEISYTEFIASFMDSIVYKNDKHIKKAFKEIDKDNSGKLSKAELKQFLEQDTIPLGDINIDDLIKQADKDGDGEIDYNEFMDMLRQKQAESVNS